MRTLTQPGPLGAPRIEMAGGVADRLSFPLRTGVSLHEAVTVPLVAAGFTGGTVVIEGGALDPFHYVMPGPPDDASHVAYFTAPRAPAGVTRLERANLTFGWAEDAPFLHCHAVWVEPDGSRRGGHILPRETVVVGSGDVSAWGFRDVSVRTAFDPETNFTLFGVSGGAVGTGWTGGRADVANGRGEARAGWAVAARVRPNVDITLAVEDIAASLRWPDAVVFGSLGSLVGAGFADGRVVADLATEVLVRSGRVRDGRAELELAVVDMNGGVHGGVLRRGANAVLITFDLVLGQAG